MSRYLVDRIRGLPNVEVLTRTSVTGLEGHDGMLEAIRWRRGASGEDVRRPIQHLARATVPVTVTRNSDCDFAATETVAYQLSASFHPLMSPHQYILGRLRYPSRAHRCYSLRDTRNTEFAHLRRRHLRARESTVSGA